MNITLLSRPEANWLVLEAAGVMRNTSDEKSFANSCYAEIVKHNYKNILIDQRKISYGSDIIDQCNVVSHYSEEFPPEIRSLRIAIVINPRDRAVNEFWELYANNRGYPWKVFCDMDDATAFLLEEKM